MIVPAGQMGAMYQPNVTEPGFGAPSGITVGQVTSVMENQFNPVDIGQSTVESQAVSIRADEEIDSDNPDGGSGDDQVNRGRGRRRKRYHRHTQYQIQELEAFFKNCPHPDDKQRRVLSRDLGLEPLQIKFWFQNKRTQMKMQGERHENTQLRTENEKLRAENIRLREALGNASCPACGGPAAAGELSIDEHHLRIENVRLREEIDRMSAIAAKCVGKPFPWIPAPGIAENGGQQSNRGELYVPGGEVVRPIVGPSVEVEKQMIVELAVASMEELIGMVHIVEPLWIPANFGGTTTYLLNEDEYFRSFYRAVGPRRPGFRWEATRETSVIMINAITLVEILMNLNQWSTIFCAMVAKAAPLELLSAGVEDHDGALQVMSAEFQMLTPLVPSREACMARYCKQHGNGIWAVVDVSLDCVRASPNLKFRRRPSGFIVQQMPNGYSKVTWVEHVEVDDKGVHSIFRPLVNSGAAFGAKCWLSIIERQCQRFASSIVTNFPPNDVNNIEGRRSMMKLAERMVISFCASASASSGNIWTSLSRGATDDVRVMTHKSIDDPGRPLGIVLSVATSFWLPVPPKAVFDYLSDDSCRTKWDVLSKSAEILKMAHISTGEGTGNSISLLRVNATDGNQQSMLILQETSTYPTGSFIIYAPIDLPSMNMILDGGDTNNAPLLPSGFVILPDGLAGHCRGTGLGGTLLIIAFQILVNSTPDAKLSLNSVATVNNLMAGTVERIKDALGGNQTP